MNKLLELIIQIESLIMFLYWLILLHLSNRENVHEKCNCCQAPRLSHILYIYLGQHGACFEYKNVTSCWIIIDNNKEKKYEFKKSIPMIEKHIDAIFHSQYYINLVQMVYDQRWWNPKNYFKKEKSDKGKLYLLDWNNYFNLFYIFLFIQIIYKTKIYLIND